MAPIRLGVIGLSTTPTAWFNYGHMPYLKDSPHYKIVALVNSSLERAHAAITAHGLDPAVTRAYASAEELAADQDVDLVVVSVKTDQHFDLIRPVVLGGKNIFVEWPLGKNLKEAEEVALLARSKGVTTAVGMQGRLDPIVLAVRDAIAGGRVGRVLSSTVTAHAVIFGTTLPPEWEYTRRLEAGANMVTINFAHFMACFTAVLGQFASVHSVVSQQYPTVDIVGADGEVITAGLAKDTPDEVAMHGTLLSGAVATVHMHGGKPFNSSTAGGLRWIINGTEGEVEITSPTAMLHLGLPGTAVTLHSKTGKTEELKVDGGDIDASGLDLRSANVARFYEAYRRGESTRFASFGDALVLHRLIDQVFVTATTGREGTYSVTP